MIIIIGAGPAGLAAARAVTHAGQDVTVIDSAARPGGQYWRHRDVVHGYKAKRSQEYFDVLKSKHVTYLPDSSVWSIEKKQDGFTLCFLRNGKEEVLHGDKLILATGAYDRTLPFPGWDLPGSLTPGGAQALLKGHGVLVGKKIVIAGTGPFLLPVAIGCAASGAEHITIYEAHSPLRWALSLPALLLNPDKFSELRHYIRMLRKYQIRMKFGYAVSSYDGTHVRVNKVSSQLVIDTGSEQIECDAVAVGWGFVPDMTLPGILGCAQSVTHDGSVVCTVDKYQRSSQPNIWIAGESTGIGGSDLSLIEGEIAGLHASGQKIPRRAFWLRMRKRVFATALFRSYPVSSGWMNWPKPETNICRCEEVTLSDLHNSARELHALDGRSSKLFTRAGMGLCQGRTCSRNVNELIANCHSREVTDAQRISSSNRPIGAPISLGQLGDGAVG